MTEHSKLPPSSAARRVACPGSRALEERYKSTEMSPAAREGEAAHWVAADLLEHDNLPDIAPNGEPITDEMIDGGNLYLDAIHAISDETTDLHIEERVDISIIHPDCFGTPDCWFITNGELHIFDYKFGHGYVEVFENWQLIEYAAGIIDTFPLVDTDQDMDVIFHIVQPRSYHPLGNVRSWKTTLQALLPYFARLRSVEIEASQPHALTHVSPECNHCAARHACPTLRQAALTTTDVAYLNTPQELDSFQLGGELRYLTRAAELLKARIAGLEEQATAHIKRGDRVPFFTLEESPGRLVWGVEPAEVIKLGELLGFELKKPDVVITPRQAVALGLDEALVQVYCHRQRGALKLASVDESSARKIFGGGQ
jgi:Protein of unknown function (DUF2800)